MLTPDSLTSQDRCPGGDDCPGAGECKATHHWCARGRHGHWVPTGEMLIKRGTGNAYAMECEACRDGREGSIKAYNAKPEKMAALKLRDALPEVKAAKALHSHAATEADTIARLKHKQDSAHLKFNLSAKEQWDEARDGVGRGRSCAPLVNIPISRRRAASPLSFSPSCAGSSRRSSSTTRASLPSSTSTSGR